MNENYPIEPGKGAMRRLFQMVARRPYRASLILANVGLFSTMTVEELGLKEAHI